MRTTTGISTEAIYIFHNMLRKLLTTYKPEYICRDLESSEPTFRSESYAEYKANRAEMPEDLGAQIAYVRKLLDALRIPILEYRGIRGGRRDRDDRAAGGGKRRTGRRDRVERQGHAATGHGPGFHAEPDERRHLYDPKKTEEFMGVPPGRSPTCWH